VKAKEWGINPLWYYLAHVFHWFAQVAVMGGITYTLSL
jgi:hypothetical protein